VDASQNVTLAGTLTATGVTTVPAGTVSAPAITTTGDTNTGIYFPAADTIAFTEGGVEAMRLDASGRLAIGTTSTAAKLEVYPGNVSTVGTIASSGLMIGNFSGAGNLSQIGFGYTTGATNTTAYIALVETSGAAFAFGDLIFGTRSVSTDTIPTERMRLDSSGNLLVGTTSAIGSGLLSVLATASTNGVACQQVTNTNRTFAGLNSSGTTTFSVTGAGAVTKASGTFCIDHPLPELEATHNLVHSFIEGPQADLIYRGKVTLVNGTTSVNIDQAATMTDGTFVLLCRNVQCFTTNESDWTAVRGAVSGNILTIEAQDNTSTANISWMVIGERQDKHMYETGWTDDNGRPIVEPLKDANA
jgi:hypothetical protein